MGKQDRGRKASRNDYDDYDEGPVKSGLNSLKIEKIKFKNEQQAVAYETIDKFELSFMVGPAGTAKTFLAVHNGLESLKHEHNIDGMVLVRPAVEAGEHIGYLPGTIEEKLDPYMRPLLDNIQDLVGNESTRDLIEKGIIQFIPLGYLRGRTLKNKFIILDEMQNATREQLRLALTRIGDGSVCVVTADPTQIDLKNKEDSCVTDIYNMFRNEEGIGFHLFRNGDIVRSRIVKHVLSIYDKHEKANSNPSNQGMAKAPAVVQQAPRKTNGKANK